MASAASRVTEYCGHSWRRLGVAPAQLRLSFTLPTGQTFRWRQRQPDGSVSLGIYKPIPPKVECEFIGVLQTSVVIFRQLPDDVLYRVVATTPPACGARAPAQPSPEEFDAVVRDYLNLSPMVDLAALCEGWRSGDERFGVVGSTIYGARVLRQDPVECLFCFLCSSNNNIKRIHLMIDKLCERYGTPLGGLDGVEYYAFPTLQQLGVPNAEEMEAVLRADGFGYRAKFIAGSVAVLKQHERDGDGGAGWLLALRGAARQEATDALQAMPGIGPKVASCVALFCLEQADEVPVDTHVWQIAVRDYGLELEGKTLTPKNYEQIGAHFRGIFAERAGWAHNTLFIADIADFAKLLPEEARRAPIASPNSASKKGKKGKKPKEKGEKGEKKGAEGGAAKRKGKAAAPKQSAAKGGKRQRKR